MHQLVEISIGRIKSNKSKLIKHNILSLLLGVEDLPVVAERLELDVDGGLVLNMSHGLELDVGLS